MKDVVFFSFGIFRSIAPYRLANEIRDIGYSCQVISLFSKFDYNSLKKVCEKFIGEKTIMVGVSTAFWQPENSEVYINLRKIIKELDVNVKFVMGGVRAKEVSQITNDEVNAIVLGQGETLVIDLLKSYTSNSHQLQEPKEIFNGIPIYEAEKILVGYDFTTNRTSYIDDDCIFPEEPLVLETSRGCIFNCSFCAFPLNGKKKNDYIKSHESLEQELIENYNKFGTTHYLLSDDTFNDSTEKVKHLHSLFTRLPFKITFTCYIRLDLLRAHQEQISLLEEMGLVGAYFGIETFHEQAARVVGKGIAGDKAKQFLHELKTQHWKDKVKVCTSLITGIPGETLESLEQTRMWIEDPENLIESVEIYRLGVCDPMRDLIPYRSEFQLNAGKYGFYFPEADPWEWKNMTGPVKTRKHSDELAVLATKSGEKGGRIPGSGGFRMTAASTVGSHSNDKKSFDDFAKMSRFEFNNWWNHNMKSSYMNYINNYVDRLLKL